MTDCENMRLCGGTFLVLLLEARGQRRKSSKNNGRPSDGKNNHEIFSYLVRMVNLKFQIPNDASSFRTFTSEYKQCQKADCESAGLTDKSLIKNFDGNINDRYSEQLENFYKQLKTAIDFESKGPWLAAALLNLIEGDVTIPDDALFHVLPNGQTVKKAALRNIELIHIPSFILGVWHYIITNIPDNKVGKATIEHWLESKGEPHSERKFISEIGMDTVSVIKTYIQLPESEDSSCSSEQVKASDPAELNKGSMSKIPQWPKNSPKLLYKSTFFENFELSCATSVIMAIDLNTKLEQFSSDSSEDVFYKFETFCEFTSEYDFEGARLIKVSLNINDTMFYGYTNPQNWESRSTLHNVISKSPYKCVVWFYVLSGNSENNIIQLLMIGRHYEQN